MFRLKSSDPFTQGHSILSHKNGIFRYNAAKTSKLETLYFLIGVQRNKVVQLNMQSFY
jgi:hypothetical protein